MAQQVINIGSAPNDGTGDQLRTAFDKCNDNFTELYAGGPGGGAVDSVNGQTGTVVLDATDVDALQRDGSNANSDIDIDIYSFNAKSLHAKGTAGSGHLGLKHQSSNATASANETSLFAGSDGELYYKNDGNAVVQIASETWVNTGLALKSNLTNTQRILANDESGITSTGTETVCATIQIDNLGTNWAMDVFLDAIKSGATSGTQARLYLNDTANLSGTPTQLALSQSATNSNRVTPLYRKVSYKGGILKIANTTTTLQNDLANQSNAKSEITIDLNTATTRYLVFTIQRFSTAGDTVTAGRHQVILYPNV